ncbi:MAG: hypothetical protein NTY36_01530 [Deltaproteobacteria bacterium]|nr:hypothetical protein [Deltaproteobacteria bacterium]
MLGHALHLQEQPQAIGTAGLGVGPQHLEAAAGRGTTARSAAPYRDLFTSPVNRDLSQGSEAPACLQDMIGAGQLQDTGADHHYVMARVTTP